MGLFTDGPRAINGLSDMLHAHRLNNTHHPEDKHRLYEAGTKREVLGEGSVPMTMILEITVRG
jgi:hypothetical protein